MSTLIDQIADYLEAQSAGTVGTNIYTTYMPVTPANCITVISSGGVRPDEYLPTTSPTFQVLIRNEDYDAGQLKLDAVRTALHQKFNTTVVTGGTYFYRILAIAEGGHIGRDEKGRDMFSINFECLTR